MKHWFLRRLVRQFGHPRGLVGHAVGWWMARSNLERSRWAVDLLSLAPTDRLLEVGCGPGVALAHAATTGAHVVGVDVSAVMVGQARRRSGAVVHCASVEALPSFDTPFDKALAINSAGHWPDADAGLRAIRAVLRPGGTIAVVSQPRCPGATAADSAAAAADLERTLSAVGFTEVRIETLGLDPPAVCALATA
jgi:SAM-dependent methyltransferase